MGQGSRVGKVGLLGSELGLDAFAVFGEPDVRWLCGFTGSNGVALVSGGSGDFVTDFRYAEQAPEQIGSALNVRVADGPLHKEIAQCVSESGFTKVGFDPSRLSVAEHQELSESLPSQASLIAVDGGISRLRAVKDAAEVAAIAAAAALADDAFQKVTKAGIAGRTEMEVAWDLELSARELGASGMSFPPIVASAAHGALPHAEPRDVPIANDTLVVIDWGVVLDGYCSDCTRTVATGVLEEEALRVHSIVDAARMAAINALIPGKTGKEMDSISRDLIEDAGYGDYFGHGLGHGVGLEIHEAPTVGKSGNTVLEAGMIVTIEPGIYLPGRFGCRIEDLLVLTDSGSRCLTTLERGPIQVG